MASPVLAIDQGTSGTKALVHDSVDGVIGVARRWFARRTCRAESVVGPLSDARDWVAERTGLVLDSYFAAPKMAWLRRNRTTAGVVTRTDTWLLHQLSGELVTDASTASRSLLTDLDSGRWDDDLLALFGLQARRA